MLVTAWGPIETRTPALPGWRHVALGLVLGVLALPTLALLLATALGVSTETMLNDRVAQLAIGTVPLWAGMLLAVALAARLHPGGFVGLTGWAWKLRDIPIGVGVAAAGIGLTLLGSLLVSLLGASGRELGNASGFAGVSGTALIATFAVVAFGAPLVEEVFFRGLTLTVARQRMSTALSVVVSSLLFGLMHVQTGLAASVYTVAATALVGSLFAIVRVRSGRLGPSIIAHVTFNATNLTLALLTAAG
jgi:membrane protease YdiL (CAAX protease family)